MAGKKNNERPDLKQVETFLYDEADLLDRAELSAWLELYTDDGAYWMPQSPEQTDPETQISILYETRLLMNIRALNMASSMAPSMAYPVRSSHMIGNVRIKSWDETTGICEVTSNFHVVLLYRHEQTVYAGRYTHKLVQTGKGFKIAHKRVDLINCDEPMKSLVIYL